MAKYRRRKTKVVPKANMGGMVKMGIQAVSGIAKNAKEKKIQGELQEQINMNYANALLAEDNAILEDYPTSGLNNYGHYMANGGNLNIGDPPIKKDNIAVNVPSYRQKKNVGLPRKKSIPQSSLDDYSNLLSSKKELETKIQNKDSKWYQTNRDVQQELDVINNYLNSSNFDNVKDYYKSPESYNTMAKGGSMDMSPSFQTTGGDLVPLASGAELAVGNKHEESTIDNTSGIKLMENGQPKVEIEDEEVVKDGAMVFSDRLKFDKKNTYAQKAESFARKRGKLELDLSSTSNSRKRNSIERNIQKIDNKENLLFAHQESKKPEGSNDKFLQMGGGMGGNPMVEGFGEALKQGKEIQAINRGSVYAKMKQNNPLSNAYNNTDFSGAGGRHQFDGSTNPFSKPSQAINAEESLSNTIEPTGVAIDTASGSPDDVKIDMDAMYGAFNKIPSVGSMKNGGKLKRFRNGGNLKKMPNGGYIDPETGQWVSEYDDMINKPGSGTNLVAGEEGGVPTGVEKGFEFGKLVPYADNAVNAFLTSRTPKVRKPNLQRATQLNTTYNINPQLGEVRDAVEAASTGIVNNTSSSNVARNEIAGARLAGMRQSNALLSQRENAENQMRNQSALNNQQITSSNLAKMDAYDQAQTMRELGINSAISRNVTNAVSDYGNQTKEENMRKYQAQQILMDAKKYGSGVGVENILENPYAVDELRNNPKDLEYFKELALQKDANGNYTNKYASELFLQQFPEFIEK